MINEYGEYLDENGNPFEECMSECEYNEDGYCMKDQYYAECQLED